MFSQWLPKLLMHRDIRALSDDGNPGAANVFIICGPALGLLCVSLDILKGLLPVYLAINTLDVNAAAFALVMSAPVLGHALSPFDRGVGGKCISTSFGVLLALMPKCKIVLALAALYVFFSTVVKIQPMRIRSILVFLMFAIISAPVLIFEGYTALALGCVIISLTAILCHARDNTKTVKVPRQCTADK